MTTWASCTWACWFACALLPGDDSGRRGHAGLPAAIHGTDEGLLLVEGEDIEPRRYRAKEANFTYVEKTHPLKDEIEIRLLRHALREELPVLGICRGSQLLNVVSGGTLFGDVQKEIQKEDPNGPSGNVKSS